MSHTREFGSDNHSGVHPELLEVIAGKNQGHAPSYGDDETTSRSVDAFAEHFNTRHVFFVFNGTAANVLALRTLADSHEAIITSNMSHLHVDECGAPEVTGGRKLLICPTQDGKLRPQDLKPFLIRRGDQHHIQARVISVTQPTEVGTVYSLEELRELRTFANDHDLRLHIDGARLANAAVHLGCGFRALTDEIGVDAVSFGGTKNGLLYGEAVLFFDAAVCKNVRFYRKQMAQLPSKMRFMSSQFDHYLRSGLWERVAGHSNAMATRLYEGVQRIPQVEVTQKVQANSVFARIPRSMFKALRQDYFFYEWDHKTGEVRWMTTFDTQPQDIDDFVERMASLAQQ